MSYVQTNLAKLKGLLIKIKVIKGFSAKKVLKVPLGGLDVSYLEPWQPFCLSEQNH